MKNTLIVVYLIVMSGILHAQSHTVGVLSYEPNKALDGYLLLYPQNQGTAYLLNNCGEVVHKWVDNSAGPSNSCHLMEDGSLFMAKMDNGYVNSDITGGGGGQRIEHRDWDNNLLWTYTYSNSMVRMHHDFAVLPNGNVVLIAWERKNYADCISAGRDSSLLLDNELWPDHLIEVEPIGLDSGNIVWEWHAWDHLIQDYDSTKANYGVIDNHPELIDVNFIYQSPYADWLHFNSIDYNEELDQLIVSSPSLNEVWIIDHSTNSMEASGHTGGISGKGGDLLFRWGNPEVYGRGDSTDRQLGFQHDIHWMGEELPMGHPDRNHLMLFNNRFQPGVSTSNIIVPIYDTLNHEYQMLNNVFLPVGFDYSYTTPNPASMFCAVVSSSQRLPNGNTLICSGRKGYTLEVDSLDEIVWEYKTPLNAGAPVNQGTTIPLSGNITFRSKKFSVNFPGFVGKTLNPQGFIELSPDINFCSNVLAGDVNNEMNVTLYPNPTSKGIRIEGLENAQNYQVNLYDLTGKLIFNKSMIFLDALELDLTTIVPGIYYLVLEDSQATFSSLKIIKQ